MLTGQWKSAKDIDWEWMEDNSPDIFNPAIGVRINEGVWEIGMYGQVPTWQPYPEIRTREEAQATAVALWQMK